MWSITIQGFTSIYSGLSAAIARQASYGTARIGLHRTFSDALQARNDGQPLPFASKAASGMLAGSLAVCIGTPMDVALVRMQVCRVMCCYTHAVTCLSAP